LKIARAASLALVLSTPAFAAEPTADTIISRTLDAMGGAETLRELRNVRIAAAWTENGAHFKGDYRATRDGTMRIDVFIDGKRVYSEGLDDKGAWEQAGEGAAVVDVGGAARDALLHGISYRFDGIWFARDRGHRLSYEGAETVDGAAYHVMKLTFADGFQTHFYVNPKTWVLDRQRDERAYHPTNDPKKITVETIQTGFAKRCGVPLAFTSRDVNLATGALLAERRVTSAQCNVDPSALDMARPR
jgi:hypothetical protein